MKQIFRVIMCVALFAGLPAFADVSKGWDAYKNGDYETALRESRPIAEQGNARAQFTLGRMYEQGFGVPQDYHEALKWYTLSAEQSHPTAQNNLGRMYYKGWGVLKDYQEAVKWYTLSAEQGISLAQFNLGTMYHNGHSVPKDYVLAYMWYNLAASNGVSNGAILRDTFLEKEMTSNQISEAQKLSRECVKKNYKGC